MFLRKVLLQLTVVMRDVFELGIKVAAEQLGYYPLKVEDIQGPIAIHATIVEEIYTSDVIVADVSLPNPNVYYELGGSHARHAVQKHVHARRRHTGAPAPRLRCHAPADQ